jgi:uncharacterized protein
VTASAPNTRDNLWAGGLIAAVLILTFLPLPPQQTTSIKNARFVVDIADNESERKQGLSGKKRLQANQAMLFVFDKPDKHCFWMKDMRFNIDILWFDASKRLIHQERNVSPRSYPHSFCPSSASSYVLETKAGTADRLKLELTDFIELKNL